MLPDAKICMHYELDFQVMLGTAVMALEGHASPAVESIYNRAVELCKQIEGTPQLGRVLWGLWRFYNSDGMLQKSRHIAEQLLTLAEQHDDPALLLMACQTLATSLLFLSDHVTAHVYCKRGIQLATAIIGQKLTTFLPYDPGIACYGFSTWTLWLSGYADQALVRSAETLKLTRGLTHPGTLVAMLTVTAFAPWWCRQASAIDERAQELAMLCDAQRFPIYAAHSLLWQGLALCLQGQVEAGVARMRQGLAALQTTGSRLVRPFFLAMLAEGCTMIGAIDEGLQALDEALQDVSSREERVYEAELYRLQGELLARQSPKRLFDAEQAVHRALVIARCQQAKSLELRAAMSLARLWQQEGKRSEARELLAPIYGWFTEGFATADLQEARRLLGQLT
jgi:predicted ATPase